MRSAGRSEIVKLRLFVGLGAVIVIAAMVAVGASAKGKPPTTGVGCKPNVTVILKGTLASDGAAAPFSLLVTVKHTNHAGRAYKNATQPISILVTTDTKIHRGHSTSSADLKTGDRVNIRARACKADLANNATPTLTAVRITAHASKS
jgi:hypothetical protein